MSLRVAIVGCGKIADAHAEQIRRIKGCDIVGVCDREDLMARQLAERFTVERMAKDYISIYRSLSGMAAERFHLNGEPASLQIAHGQFST